MEPSDAPAPPIQSRGLQAAHDRIRRKRERLAAEAQAAADAEALATGITPSSSADPSIPTSTTIGSLSFSTSSSTSGFQYNHPSSASAYQLSLPGPLTPLRSIYPGYGDTPPLPSQSALGLTTSASASGSATGSGFGSAVLSGAPPPPMTAAERRRAKEAAGEAMGLEDEIDWGYEEETLPVENAIRLPSKEEVERASTISRQEARAMKEERRRKEELALRLAGAPMTEPIAGDSVSESGSGGIAETKKGSRWNPHSHGVSAKDTSSVGFQILREAGYKEIGIDAQYKKEKKKEDRKELVGRLFGKKGKSKEEGRKREAWEDQLEGLSRGESESKGSLHPSASQPNSSKVSLPSSSSQPIRSILKQPGQPSRRMLPSFTDPSLTSLSADPTRPSPATQNTALTSISGLPSSSYNIITPSTDTAPLPPTSGRPKGGRPDTAGTVTQAMYAPGLEPLVRPFGQGMTHEANMDRRPSLASSMGGSAVEPGRNDTQTSLASATSSSGLFYSGTAPALAPPIGLPDTAPPEAGPSSRKKTGFFGALAILGSSSQPLPKPPRAFPMPPEDPTPPAAEFRPDASPLLAALPLLEGVIQDSRYPDISPELARAALPASISLPSYSFLGVLQGFNNARRPSDTRITYGPQTPRADPDIRRARRRSASETIYASPGSVHIVPPASRYVPHRRNRTSDSEYEAAVAAAVAAYSTVDSPESQNSLASVTRESLGMVLPPSDPVRRYSRTIPAPIYGIPPSTASASTALLYSFPPRPAQDPSPIPATKPAPGFFARNASAINLALYPPKKLPLGTQEHFESKDPVYRTVAFQMNPEERESRMETYIPPSNSSSRLIVTAILPPAPCTMGRIEPITKFKATVMVRMHPNPLNEEPGGKSGKSRPGTAASLAPTLRSFIGGGSRPGTATTITPRYTHHESDEPTFRAKWKKMILVITSFSFDGSDDKKTGKPHIRTERSTHGAERSVAHLHLFDSSATASPIKRPQTSDTFGAGPTPRPFGLNRYVPESERMEVDRRALMYDSMVVLGDVVDKGRKDWQGLTKEEEKEKRTRRDVVWVGFSEYSVEGWFIKFENARESKEFMDDTRLIIRRMGKEHLHRSMYGPQSHLVTDSDSDESSFTPPPLPETIRPPAEHILHHLSLGHSIWDPRTNPPPLPPRGSLTTTPEFDDSPEGRWARYEHPALRVYRERDKFLTFGDLSYGRVGWREWDWPIPPGKQEKDTTRKAEKRAAGRRRRRRKFLLKRAARNKGKGVARGEKKAQVVTPRQVLASPGSEGGEGTELPLLISDAIRLERSLELTPPRPDLPARASSSSLGPSPTSYGNFPAQAPRSPLRPLLLSADSSRSIVLPRQPSNRSIAPSVLSVRSATSAYSGTSAGSGDTVRSGGTFGRSPTAPTAPPVRPMSTAGRPGSSAGRQSRPGTANRNLPPPSLPPPSAPLPAPPTSSPPSEPPIAARLSKPPSGPLPPIPKSATSSLSSYSSGDTDGQDRTPKAVTLGLFPTPPTTTPLVGSGSRPPSAAGAADSTVPAFGAGSMRRTASTTPAPPSAFPAQLAASALPHTPRVYTSAPPTHSAATSISSLPYRIEAPSPGTTPGPGPAPGNWYAGSSSAMASSASLASEGSGGMGSASGSTTSGGTGAGRRRRVMTPVVDLAGEIKAIDDARAAEIRAAEAAVAAAEEPIDDNRPRVIRFAE